MFDVRFAISVGLCKSGLAYIVLQNSTVVIPQTRPIIVEEWLCIIEFLAAILFAVNNKD